MTGYPVGKGNEGNGLKMGILGTEADGFCMWDVFLTIFRVADAIAGVLAVMSLFLLKTAGI